MVDITHTITPKSDQLNADDFVVGEKTYTVDSVKVVAQDQPVHIFFKGEPRAFKPCKSMRRILAEIWGTESSAWAGEKITLYRDPNAQFGGQKVGGIRISHMSRLTAKKDCVLSISKGKRALFTILPIIEKETEVKFLSHEPVIEAINDCQGMKELQAVFISFNNNKTKYSKESGQLIIEAKDAKKAGLEQLTNSIEPDSNCP